jgi:protein ImuA
MVAAHRSELIQKLRNDVLQLEGFRSVGCDALDVSMGPLRDSFPGKVFPTAAIHEFIAEDAAGVAATSGFICSLLSVLVRRGGVTVWISHSRTLFPPALKRAGIDPGRFIFIDLNKEKDVAWAIDEALKCDALTAVVGEVHSLDFTTSRRYQLAVEQSKVTGILLRRQSTRTATGSTACVSRWRITSLPSLPIDDLPGIGHPQWKVDLLRIRNGRTGSWRLNWSKGKFVQSAAGEDLEELKQKTG